VVYGEKDWNNWSVGVKYALTKKSELLAAWNQRIDDTDNRDFNTPTVGVNAKSPSRTSATTRPIRFSGR